MSDQTDIPRNAGFSVVVPSAPSNTKNKNSSISRRFKNLIHKLEKSVTENKDKDKHKTKELSPSVHTSNVSSEKTASELTKNSIGIKSPILQSSANMTSIFTPSAPALAPQPPVQHPLARTPSESVMHLKTDLNSNFYPTRVSQKVTNLPVQNIQHMNPFAQAMPSINSAASPTTDTTTNTSSTPDSQPQPLNQSTLTRKKTEYVSKRQLFTENEPVFFVGDLNLARNSLPKFVPIPEVHNEGTNHAHQSLDNVQNNTQFPCDGPITPMDDTSVAGDIPTVHINPSFFASVGATTGIHDQSDFADKHVSGTPPEMDHSEVPHTSATLGDHINSVTNEDNHSPKQPMKGTNNLQPTPDAAVTLPPNFSSLSVETFASASTSTSISVSTSTHGAKTGTDQPEPVSATTTPTAAATPKKTAQPTTNSATTNDVSAALASKQPVTTPKTQIEFQPTTAEKKSEFLPIERPPSPASHAGSQTSLSRNTSQMVYSKHDIGLNKYGKTTKIIGKGTGGTVRLLQSVAVEQRPPSTRNTANTSHSEHENAFIPSQQKLFAVKEFRKRRTDETPRNYMKKVTSEFCIGSSLHHENVIETLDLIFEGERVYEIMEYCPYDLFKFVALGEMGLDETFCWFKQVCQAVSYIHTIGISHRDLKLENILLTHEGIVKLIDFGCATVFKAPFQKLPNKLTGVYGSDPYIAPEIFSSSAPYDAEAADVWSVGIMYMCMTLLKFPWRIAKKDQEPNFASYVNNWPKGRDKLFAQLPLLRDDGNEFISNLVNPNSELRPSLTNLLKSKWAQGVETCRPGKKARGHTHNMDTC